MTFIEDAKAFFAKLTPISLAFHRGTPCGWRTRAKLACRKGANGPVIGLFEQGSHTVIPILDCPDHHPAINKAVKQVLQEPFSAYDEASHTGDLRYIQCTVERKTGRVQLVLVLNCTPYENMKWHTLCLRLYNPSFWHSIWINYNPKRTNTIFGHQWQKVAGGDTIWDELNGIDVAFGPAHFIQANLEMYEKLLQELVEYFPAGKKVLELYAGIGSIGMQVVKKSQSLTLTEVQHEAYPYFMQALEKRDASILEKVSYQVLEAKKSLTLVDEAEVCIVDPPRKGLDKEVVSAISSSKNLQELVYVSCNFETLARDITAILEKNPEWQVKRASCYLFFPGTDHIETLVFLSRPCP